MKYNIAVILLVKSIIHFCEGYSQQLASISFEKIKGSTFYGLDRFNGEYSAEYCLSKNAFCDRLFSASCSWCICKDMMTFVSYRDGCKDRRDADVILGVSGQMCFGVQISQRVYPMFTVDELFSQWFILIPQTTYYEIPTKDDAVHYDANSSQCWAKEVYLIDLNGKRNLLWCNYNQKKLQIFNDGRYWMRASQNASKDEFLQHSGRLLLVNIDCKHYSNPTQKTCFIFKIVGTYKGPKYPGEPTNKQCLATTTPTTTTTATTPTTTTTTSSTTTSTTTTLTPNTTSKTATSTVAKITTPTTNTTEGPANSTTHATNTITNLPHTTTHINQTTKVLPDKTITGESRDTGDETQTLIIVGVIAVFLIVLVTLLIFVFFRKQKKQKNNNERSISMRKLEASSASSSSFGNEDNEDDDDLYANNQIPETNKRQKSVDNTYDYADFSQVSKELPNNNYEDVKQKPKRKKNKNKKQSRYPKQPVDNEGYEVAGPGFVTPNLIYEDSSSSLPLNEYEDVATKPKPVLDEQIYQEADTPNPTHKKPQSPRKLNAYEVADLPESSGQVSDLPGVTIKREQNASYEPANSFLREENENIYYETEPSPAAQSFLQQDTENFYYEKEPSPLAQRQQENSYYAKDGLLNQDLSDDNIYTEPGVGSASPNTHINPIYG